MTSRPYFLCVENYDRGEHHYRVYEPVGGDHEDAWLEQLAEEYLRIVDPGELILEDEELDLDLDDIETIKHVLRKASIPRGVSGAFSVVRSDFGELIAYLLLEDHYGTLIVQKNIFYREARDLPSRGIDVIGIEQGEMLRLVIGEVKVSEEKLSPPRVVEKAEDSLHAQHSRHVTHLCHETRDKLCHISRFIKDQKIKDLLVRIILYLSKGEVGSIQLVVCSVLVRPQEYYCMTDFGAFRSQPEHYAPGAVRFLIARVPERIEATVKKWYALIQQRGEGSS